MGSIISLITGAIGLGQKVATEIYRDKNRKLQKEADRLANPIKPPEYWPTLEARQKHSPTGPYSIDAIREGLKQGVLPAGYSVDQLRFVGFDTNDFEYNAEKEKKQLRASFGEALRVLADAVSSELTGQDIGLRKALARAGVTQSTVARFNNLAKQATLGLLEPEAVNTAISELRTLLDRTQVEQGISANIKESKDAIAKASDDRNTALLGVLGRALKRKPQPAITSN